MAVKIVIEPIFETGFEDNSYGKQVYKRVQEVLKRIDLMLNENKTRILNIRKGDTLDFLGFTYRQVVSYRNGKPFIMVVPSNEAMKKIRKTVKNMLTEGNKEKLENVITKLTGYWKAG